MRTIARRSIFINIRKIKRAAIILCAILTAGGLLTFSISQSVTPSVVWQNISTFFLGFDISDVGSIVREIPIIGIVNSSHIVANAQGGAIPAARTNIATTFEGDGFFQNFDIYPRELGEDEFPIDAIFSGAASGVFVNNETNIDVDIDDFLSRSLNFDFSGEGPHILIVHTHTTEAFTPLGVNWYHISNNKRSQDEAENVVRVGAEISRIFQENGFEVAHSRSMHDYPSFSGSYQNALATIERYRQRYPSIQLVLDVHRDAIIRECGTKIKLLSEVDEQNAAQVMFVVGTNAGGLSHDNWRDNLALTAQLQESILDGTPGLARPINLRRERFNQNATRGSILIEVGTSGNTLDEAILGARYAALGMAEFLQQFK